MRCRPPTESQLEWPKRPPLPAPVVEAVRDRPEAVIRALSALVSEDRQARIDMVLARRTRSVVVLLDHVNDPHNSAAVLRSAEGLGLQEVHAVDPDGALPLGRRVTQGCHKWLDLVVHCRSQSAVDALRERGYTLLGASERATKTPADYRDVGPVALCMGNEHEGLSAEVTAACDGEVGIAMEGFTRSLNVSVAAALLLSGLVEGRPRGLPSGELASMRARFYVQSVKHPIDLLERGGVI